MAFAGGHGSHGKKGNHNKQSIGQNRVTKCSQSMNCSANGGSGFGYRKRFNWSRPKVYLVARNLSASNSNPQTNINQGRKSKRTSQ